MPRTGVASRRSIEPGLAGRVNPVSTGGGAWAPSFCPKPILLAGRAAAGCRANAERIAARRLTRSLTRLLLMFRHSLLPCTCFGVALGIAVALPIPAHSQDRSTYDRLDRLERDLNMLQRQVYRGAPAPVPGRRHPGGAM